MVDIFWSKDDTEGSEGGLIGVNGIPSAGNRRPTKTKKNVRGKKTVEVKARVPPPQKSPVVQTLPCEPTKETTEGNKKASLKDLCLEDKQRIANLIKELARLGEEKESTVQAFERERSQFEGQVHALLSQQQQILTERESIQQQLHDCQDLLIKYQQLVNDQKQQLVDSMQEQPSQKNKSLKANHCRTPLQRLTHENANGIPTRRGYQKELSQHKFESSTQRHSNYEPEAERSKTQASHPNGHGHAETNELSRPRVGSDTAERPFTSLIDRLIADERNQCSSTSSRSLEDRELRLGPLARPLPSDSDKSQDFKPLVPDFRATPQLSEGASVFEDEGAGSSEADPGGIEQRNDSVTRSNVRRIPLPQPKSVSTPLKKGPSALAPEGLSEAEFREYYQQLTPEDRKRQLFVQKQALLDEQERLKRVLVEQEALLEQKHRELRRQQSIQKQRLDHFQQTGAFPAHFSYSDAPSAAGSLPGFMPAATGVVRGSSNSAQAFANHLEYSIQQQQQQYRVPPIGGAMRQPLGPLNPAGQSHFNAPYPPPHVGHPPSYGLYPSASEPFNVQGRSNWGENGFVPLQPDSADYQYPRDEDIAWRINDVYRANRPQLSAQSSNFAQKGPIDALGASQKYWPTSGHAREHYDDLAYHGHTRDHLEPEPTRQHYNRSTQNPSIRDGHVAGPKRNTLNDLRTDSAARLLELVEEVESLHNGSNLGREEEEDVEPRSLAPYLQPSSDVMGRELRASLPFSDESNGSNIGGGSALDYHYHRRDWTGKLARDSRGRAEQGGGWSGIARGLGSDDEGALSQSGEELEESQVLEEVFFIK